MLPYSRSPSAGVGSTVRVRKFCNPHAAYRHQVLHATPGSAELQTYPDACVIPELPTSLPEKSGMHVSARPNAAQQGTTSLRLGQLARPELRHFPQRIGYLQLFFDQPCCRRSILSSS